MVCTHALRFQFSACALGPCSVGSLWSCSHAVGRIKIVTSYFPRLRHTVTALASHHCAKRVGLGFDFRNMHSRVAQGARRICRTLQRPACTVSTETSSVDVAWVAAGACVAAVALTTASVSAEEGPPPSLAGTMQYETRPEAIAQRKFEHGQLRLSACFHTASACSQ